MTFIMDKPEWQDVARGTIPWSVVDGSIPGLEFAYGTINPKSHLAHINSIVVAENSRRQGIGRKAVLELESFLKSSGATRINGWAKEGSESFWRSMGYEVNDVRGHLPRISKTLTQDKPVGKFKTTLHKRTLRPDHPTTMMGGIR